MRMIGIDMTPLLRLLTRAVEALEEMAKAQRDLADYWKEQK